MPADSNSTSSYVLDHAPDQAFCVDSAHPALPGHFPGMPVVPGVVVLSRVLAEVRRQFPALQIAGINKLKFLRVLLPEQRFTVEFEQPSVNAMRFKCWQDGAVLTEGRLAIQTSASEAMPHPGLPA